MSGHSKWHSIKHKKGAADAKRGRIFTRHARLIALAAKQGGGDPEMNPTLRLAVEKAKIDNLPNNNIDKAIKKGTGELKEGAEISEATYEGYGPCGVAFMIHAVTDNRNRSLSNIRRVMEGHGGTLGASGAVAWMFEKRGVIIIELPQEKSSEEIELAAIDAGALDSNVSENMIEIYTDPRELMKIKSDFIGQGIKVASAELTLVAKDNVKIDDENKARRIINLMEELESDDDVTDISSNFDIPEEILKKIA